MPINPAASVRGPRHVVTSGQTPVLDPSEALALLAAPRLKERLAAIRHLFDWLVTQWYRQSTFPGTRGNYLHAEVRRAESVENEAENWRMGPLTSSLWISLAVQSSSGEPPSELTD